MAVLLGVTYLKYKPVEFLGDYLLKVTLGMAILLFMLSLNSRISIGNKVSGFLGNISYEIFLLHGMAFSLISWAAAELDSGRFILVSITITVLLSVWIKTAGMQIWGIVDRKMKG